jgi:hypothetical protein
MDGSRGGGEGRVSSEPEGLNSSCKLHIMRRRSGDDGVGSFGDCSTAIDTDGVTMGWETDG